MTYTSTYMEGKNVNPVGFTLQPSIYGQQANVYIPNHVLKYGNPNGTVPLDLNLIPKGCTKSYLEMIQDRIKANGEYLLVGLKTQDKIWFNDAVSFLESNHEKIYHLANKSNPTNNIITVWLRIHGSNISSLQFDHVGEIDCSNYGEYPENHPSHSAGRFIAAFCNQHNPKANLRVAAEYKNSAFVNSDVNKFFKYVSAAAAKNDINGYYNLGMCYKKGLGTPVDMGKAVQLLANAAVFHPMAQLELGLYYLETGDVQKAFDYFTAAAAQNIAEASFQVAELLSNGKIVSTPRNLSLPFYRHAALANHPGAQAKYGLAMVAGHVEGKGLQDALLLFKESAEAGNPDGEFYYGKALIDAKFRSEDILLGVEYWMKAAGKGQLEAAHMLGSLFEKGITGVIPRDTNLAFMYYQQAAHGGEKLAYLPYGKMCIEEKTNQNMEGRKYLQMAQDLNIPGTTPLLIKAYEKLDLPREAIQIATEALRAGQDSNFYCQTLANLLMKIYVLLPKNAGHVQVKEEYKAVAGEALVALGEFLYKAKKFAHAASSFKRASDLKNAKGNYCLANMYYHGQVPSSSPQPSKIAEIEKAVVLLGADSNRYDPASKQLLAKIYLEHGNNLKVKVTPNTAFELIESAANSGYPPACYNLGLCLIKMKRIKEGFDYIKKSAAADHVSSLMFLGLNYLTGQHIPIDYEEAYKYLSRANDKGVESSCLGLGYLYSFGLGSTANYHKAMELLTKPNVINHRLSLFYRSRLHLLGLGCDKNPQLGLELLNKSHEAGCPLAKPVIEQIFAKFRGHQKTPVVYKVPMNGSFASENKNTEAPPTLAPQPQYIVPENNAVKYTPEPLYPMAIQQNTPMGVVSNNNAYQGPSADEQVFTNPEAGMDYAEPTNPTPVQVYDEMDTSSPYDYIENNLAGSLIQTQQDLISAQNKLFGVSDNISGFDYSFANN